MFKVNNKDTRTTSMASRRRSGIFIVNFELILRLVLVFQMHIYDSFKQLICTAWQQ